MEKIYVAVTDYTWYKNLKLLNDDHINFWSPSGNTKFRAISEGDLFLFKLHHPNNFIAGGGIFESSSNISLDNAWSKFGAANGASSLDELRHSVNSYNKNGNLDVNPTIGSRVLVNPFFLSSHDWIPTPRSFSKYIMRGKTYRIDEPDGQYILDAINRKYIGGNLTMNNEKKWGSSYLVLSRNRQQQFRNDTASNYNNRCAFTGECVLQSLDAAHIVAYSGDGTHCQSNGILLRKDLHCLFDTGFITIGEDHKIIVSDKINDLYPGNSYYSEFNGKSISEPALTPLSNEALKWHRENIFRH